jgi:hypothetical protein
LRARRADDKRGLARVETYPEKIDALFADVHALGFDV